MHRTKRPLQTFNETAALKIMPSHELTFPKTYPTAIDLWVAVMLVLSPLVAALAGIYAWSIGQADSAIILFLTGAGAAALNWLLLLPCRYTLTEDSLTIRSGILIYRVNWDDVVSVEKSSSWRSGPALSLCRVAVATKRKTYLISPKNRDEFIGDVTRILNPMLAGEATSFRK
jgi:Bacterial PH domain